MKGTRGEGNHLAGSNHHAIHLSHFHHALRVLVLMELNTRANRGGAAQQPAVVKAIIRHRKKTDCRGLSRRHRSDVGIIYR